MKMAPRMSLAQRQRLALTPVLRTALGLLRLPTMELFDVIEQEVAENPFLLADDLRQVGADQFAGQGPAAFDAAMNLVAAEPTLVEDLRHQLALMKLPDDVRAVAEYIAGDLREDGYLDTPLAELSVALGLPLELVDAGLAAVQACDPAGVGARSLAECLELQLADRGVAADLARRIIAHLDMFAAGNRERLALLLGLSEAQIAPLTSLVRTLQPRPVADRAPPAAPLMPDLVLENARGSYQVSLGVLSMPQIRLNTDLLRAAGMRDAEADEPFVAERRARAETLIKALRFRGETLLRIGEWIAARQHRFFALGPDHLVPVSRAELGRALGLHASTVGRAVSGKALEAGGRLYPLSVFFSQALPLGGNAVVSSFVVQRLIVRLVAAESPHAPLSDDAICQMLRAEGVDIARRTVAKYRGYLRISSSFSRRRLRPLSQGPASDGYGGLA